MDVIFLDLMILNGTVKFKNKINPPEFPVCRPTVFCCHAVYGWKRSGPKWVTPCCCCCLVVVEDKSFNLSDYLSLRISLVHPDPFPNCQTSFSDTHPRSPLQNPPTYFGGTIPTSPPPKKNCFPDQTASLLLQFSQIRKLNMSWSFVCQFLRKMQMTTNFKSKNGKDKSQLFSCSTFPHVSFCLRNERVRNRMMDGIIRDLNKDAQLSSVSILRFFYGRKRWEHPLRRIIPWLSFFIFHMHWNQIQNDSRYPMRAAIKSVFIRYFFTAEQRKAETVKRTKSLQLSHEIILQHFTVMVVS